MDSRDALNNERRALVWKQAAQLERQAAQIAELELKLAKALKDSSTSSKPPSSDIAKPKPKKKPEPPKKPRPGGQPGHEQQIRQCVIDRRITQGARTQRNGRSCFAHTPPASSSLDAQPTAPQVSAAVSVAVVGRQQANCSCGRVGLLELGGTGCGQW